MIEAARHAPSVDKTVLIGTVCSYPKFTPVPFAEDDLWNGYPEETNAPYGIAKKAHLVHAQVNAQQYGQRFAYLIPTNLYGPGDKFHPSVSHVIPALIKKCVEATEAGADHVDVWGTGIRVAGVPLRRRRSERDRPRCRAERPRAARSNRSTSVPTAKSRSRKRSRPSPRLVGFDGELRWDPTKPDGQPRRGVDGSRANAVLGWTPTIALQHGMRATSTGTSRTAPRPNETRTPDPHCPPHSARRSDDPGDDAGSPIRNGERLHVSCALSPLGLGTTQNRAPSKSTGCSPITAFGSSKRRAIRRDACDRHHWTAPVTHQHRSCSPPSRSSSADSSDALAVARWATLEIPRPRPRK